MLHALKYQRFTALADPMARFFYVYLKDHGTLLPPDAVLTPIPIHPERERTRGFNQSDLIARRLAGIIGAHYHSSLLARVLRTAPQAGLGGDARRANVRAAFALRDRDAAVGRTIILFDDIRTTGATLEEAALLLKNSGARRVWAMTMAH